MQKLNYWRLADLVYTSFKKRILGNAAVQGESFQKSKFIFRRSLVHIHPHFASLVTSKCDLWEAIPTFRTMVTPGLKTVWLDCSGYLSHMWMGSLFHLPDFHLVRQAEWHGSQLTQAFTLREALEIWHQLLLIGFSAPQAWTSQIICSVCGYHQYGNSFTSAWECECCLFIPSIWSIHIFCLPSVLISSNSGDVISSWVTLGMWRETRDEVWCVGSARVSRTAMPAELCNPVKVRKETVNISVV